MQLHHSWHMCLLHAQVQCFGQHQLLEYTLLGTPAGYQVNHHLFPSPSSLAVTVVKRLKPHRQHTWNTTYYQACHLVFPQAQSSLSYPIKKQLLKAHLHRRRIMDAAETWSLSIAWSIPCLGFDVLHFSSTWYCKQQQWIQRLNWSPRCIYKAAACSSQDGNNLETRSVVPSLITGPFTQCLHWGDTMIKTVGSPTILSTCAGPCDLPKDGKLIRVTSKSKKLNIYNEVFFICVGIQLGFNNKKQKKVQHLLKRSQVCQWANSLQKTSVIYN